jgi:urate oxidase
MARTLLIIGADRRNRSVANSPGRTGGFTRAAHQEQIWKGRVRVMRIHRDGDKHEVSQLNVKAMLEGDFARAYTQADNSTSVSTDTIKNVVNIVVGY